MKPLFAIALAVLAFQESPQDTIVRMTNELRAKEKVAVLKKNDKLGKIAQAHADTMAKADKYGDDNHGHIMNGKKPVERVEAGGYLYLLTGENVGFYGMLDPAKMVDTWWKSPGHKSVMVHVEFTEIGIGAAKSKSGKWYYVQVFGVPR